METQSFKYHLIWAAPLQTVKDAWQAEQDLQPFWEIFLIGSSAHGPGRHTLLPAETELLEDADDSAQVAAFIANTAHDAMTLRFDSQRSFHLLEPIIWRPNPLTRYTYCTLASKQPAALCRKSRARPYMHWQPPALPRHWRRWLTKVPALRSWLGSALHVDVFLYSSLFWPLSNCVTMCTKFECAHSVIF